MEVNCEITQKALKYNTYTGICENKPCAIFWYIIFKQFSKSLVQEVIFSYYLTQFTWKAYRRSGSTGQLGGKRGGECGGECGGCGGRGAKTTTSPKIIMTLHYSVVVGFKCVTVWWWAKHSDLHAIPSVNIHDKARQYNWPICIHGTSETQWIFIILHVGWMYWANKY